MEKILNEREQDRKFQRDGRRPLKTGTKTNKWKGKKPPTLQQPNLVLGEEEHKRGDVKT